MESWEEGKLELLEQFKIVLLDRSHRVLGIFQASSGGICGTVVDPKLIFTTALKTRSCSLILSHNHPSGNLKPSEADLKLTRKIKQAGEILEINVLDHLINTSEGYYSFADEGVM
jgi:DNA repair protein RadC